MNVNNVSSSSTISTSSGKALKKLDKQLLQLPSDDNTDSLCTACSKEAGLKVFGGRRVVQTCGTVGRADGGLPSTVVELMVNSPGRREMEGTNDCTVGRGQRPDIAHKAQSKPYVSPIQPTVALVGCAIKRMYYFCADTLSNTAV